ncbi:DUF2889 domain-containing protein [Neptuniibacter caesariensis]|uniref:DUF2889 domain-containing protein n=1 Tax=Neptuniibacter caesariensis TaxID=207954 RepID=A0A7U8CAE9_NEPCE|nr:DUF2889 domain-containing protein [Neptuniibacter caesariensis]EAR63099.1 hypothetical protein MED92_08266 [Oceanospirillum sp. MED92] [Neptuniibacter caesariensis]
MPLSRPVRRATHHNRLVNCNGYLREDGLWDIEAQMTDIKTHDVDNPERGGHVPAGEAFHDLSIRITLDTTLLIREAEACIDRAPFRMCGRIGSAFRKLEGTRIGPGWQRQCKELLGGVEGCTHMNELLPVLATTAIQTMWPSSDKNVLAEGAKFMLNTCHTWGQSSDMVKQYIPEHYQAADLIPVEEQQ